MLTGLTERTITNLQLNAGVLVSKYTKGTDIAESDILGATRGGGSINVKPIIRQVAVDGAPTYTKGLERIDEVQVNAQFTMVEFTPALVKRAVAGASINSSGADMVITSVSKVLEDDYKDVYWIGDTSAGQNVVVHIKNGFSLDGLSLSASDKGEGTFGLNIMAHYSINDLKNAPYSITFEGKSAE